MKPQATHVAALSLALTLTAHAQTTFSDPANLRGERITPKTGRELPIDQGALGLQQLLRKLSTRASLMLIVAHPDDEDGGMLTFYSRGLGARVAMLTLTRGEGGQNAMTGDFEDALGLIRTQELLAADRYFGADQFFGTEVDFGFSKTKAEAFSKWTHERVLYDAVRAVRLYRPLVIAAVFVGGVTDGHGQHQVSGQIAQEVFKAAADPNVFPELTAEGILPWAPLKVYARVPTFAITGKGLFDYATNQYTEPTFTNYVTGQTSTTPPTPDVVIHEGQPDPLLTTAAANPADLPSSQTHAASPLSYVQFARLGLGLQRTQIGPGVRNAPAGAFDINYHRYGSRLAHQPAEESSFFEGIDTSLAGIASLTPNPPDFLQSTLQRLGAEITNATSSLDPLHPQKLAPQLAQALDETDRLLQRLSGSDLPPSDTENIRHELLIKRVQLNDALALALGVTLDATADHADNPEGTPVKVLTRITSASPQDLKVTDVHLASPQGNQSAPPEEKRRDLPLTPDHADQRTLTFPSANTLNPTRPYFYRDSIEQPVYKLHSAALRDAPASPPALVAEAEIDYRATTIQLAHVVHAADQSVRFIPTVTVAFPTSAQVLPSRQSSTNLNVHVADTGATAVTGKLTFAANPGWNAKPSAQPLHPGDIHFTLTAESSPASPATVTATARIFDGSHTNESFRPVGYGNLPRTNFYTSANERIVPLDLRLPVHRRIGYVSGTGDAVADNLHSIGFAVSALTIADLVPEHLAHFDTVILGVRTYNAHPDLHGAPTQALLDFARNGGNVIVQYQTAEFTAADAPYPLTLGNAEKVVDETAPVRLLAPSNPALTTPNRITPADFNDWIEERGHGFLGSWDPHYTALTETHDPGVPFEHVAPQLPQEGGLLTTPLGQGHWTYVAFALYRQLPEAVPGAFRLLTNLLALADGK